MTNFTEMVIKGVRWVSGKDGVDSNTNTLQTIDYAHHEIHSGSMFRVQAFDDAIASSGTLCIGFKVSDQAKEPHFTFAYVAESYSTVELLEGATITASTGTDVLIKNSNRNSSNTSILQGYSTGAWVSNYVTKNPTYTGGSVISLKKTYSSVRAGGSGGERKNEIVLKPNTEYLLCITNDDTGAKGGQIRLEWYEHTDKNP